MPRDFTASICSDRLNDKIEGKLKLLLIIVMLQCSADQCSAVQDSEVQISAMQCSVVQLSAVQDSEVHSSAG